MSTLFSVSRQRFVNAAIRFFASLVLFTGICKAQTNLHEFTIFLGNPALDFFAQPMGITYGPDSNYWFCEFGVSRLGQINPAATTNFITQVPITNFYNTGPFGIARGVGADANFLWFTESLRNKIGHMNGITSNYVDFYLPHTNTQPCTIITGPDGNIWFSEYNLNRIAAITPAPATNADGGLMLVHESEPIETNGQIYALTSGPDGNIWFADSTFGAIYRLTLDGSFAGSLTKFTLPRTNSQPSSLVTGPDGALWFTEFNNGDLQFNDSFIGRITTNGQITEFSITNSIYPHPKPYDIIVGLDGNLWFTLYVGSAVGSITTNGIVTIFHTPTIASYPTFLATGNAPPFADSNIYFGEFVEGVQGFAYQNIGRLIVAESLHTQASTITNFTSGTTLAGLLAAFQNSNATNTIVVNWGDGTGDTLRITNIAANAFVTTNYVLVTNSMTVTNSLTITNTLGINTNGTANGDYEILASHTFGSISNYLITLTITDASNYISTAKISLPPDPFFNGEVSLGDNVEYLQFPDQTVFGYFSLKDFPYLYHFDLGFEYFIAANDGQNGAYLYDFTSTHWFYTNPATFPYLYDFTLNAWLYYYPNTNSPGHYTSNPRYFYDFGTSQTITE